MNKMQLDVNGWLKELVKKAEEARLNTNVERYRLCYEMESVIGLIKRNLEEIARQEYKNSEMKLDDQISQDDYECSQEHDNEVYGGDEE